MNVGYKHTPYNYKSSTASELIVSKGPLFPQKNCPTKFSGYGLENHLLTFRTSYKKWLRLTALKHIYKHMYATLRILTLHGNESSHTCNMIISLIHQWYHYIFC